MSWQEYIDSSLIGSGKIKEAAIIGLDGAIWANSNGFDISSEEANKLLAAYKNPSCLYEQGLYLCGVRVNLFL